VPQKGAKTDKHCKSRQKRGRRETAPLCQGCGTVGPCHVARSWNPVTVGLCHLARSCPSPVAHSPDFLFKPPSAFLFGTSQGALL